MAFISKAASATAIVLLGCTLDQSLNPTTRSSASPQSPIDSVTVRSAAADPAGGQTVLVGAGDIASCASSGDEATARLLDSIPGTVFTAGDNAYEDGSSSDYGSCYASSWGRHRARTRPAPGNHEYLTAGALGYFDYFGTAAGERGKGYYSYELGGWHIVVLNTSLDVSAGSAQEQWLRADLAAHPTMCTLAYWHHPLFSSSSDHGSQAFVRALWQALYEADADVVISGHDHDYERFAPQTPAGGVDQARGIREFVVGTGGKSHYAFGAALPNSQVRDSTAYGVLALTLRTGGYDWQFVPIAGSTFADKGSGSCHGPTQTPPGAPVASVAVSPATASVAVGQTVQLTATPKDTSGTSLTGRSVSWATSAPGVATVSGSGLARGVAAGTAVITGTSEGKSGTARVTVSRPGRR